MLNTSPIVFSLRPQQVGDFLVQLKKGEGSMNRATQAASYAMDISTVVLSPCPSAACGSCVRAEKKRCEFPSFLSICPPGTHTPTTSENPPSFVQARPD